MRAFVVLALFYKERKSLSHLFDTSDSLDTPDQVEMIAKRLKDQIIVDLEKLEAMQEPDEISGEQRLKCLTGFFKLLQTVEEMIKRNQHERDKKLERGVDILEFRKQLEKQIATIVDEKTEGVVS